MPLKYLRNEKIHEIQLTVEKSSPVMLLNRGASCYKLITERAFLLLKKRGTVMIIAIGNKIKQLRKLKGITQEQLADRIGISFQAVSKWENNTALPDITLVPALANIFGVSIDELFEYNLKQLQEKIKAICDEACIHRESNPKYARTIIENGLKSYPDNDILLNNLLYVLNYSEEPDATIRIASKLASETNDDSVKYDALRFLAYAYNAKGENDSAIAAIEQIPELYFTKLSEAAFILSGKAKFEAAEKQFWISFETLIQMCAKLSECYEADDKLEEAIAKLNCAIGFIDTLKYEQKIVEFKNYIAYFNKEIKRMRHI
jgi:transcriptional regulator with XRE-family HTH domain